MHLRNNKIKLFKYLFLSASCLILLGIIITLYIKNEAINSQLPKNTSHKDHAIPKNYTLTLNGSIFEGLSMDSKQYKISAAEVARDLNNKYILTSVAAEYPFSNGLVFLKAESGTLEEDTKFVNLQKNVELLFNSITFKTQELKCNFDTKELYGDEAIEVTFEHSRIRADQFKTKDSNNSIEFKGHVESIFYTDDFK